MVMTVAFGLRHFIVTALGTMLICATAGAQVRGGAIPHARSAARMWHASSGPSGGAPAMSRSGSSASVLSMAPQATARRFFPNGRATSNVIAAENVTSFGIANGVPGLGFDYPHLAAVSGSLHQGQPARFGRGGHRAQSTFVPILFGGYPYYGSFYDSEDYDQPQQQAQPQPQVIVIQQAPPDSERRQEVDAGDDATSPTLYTIFRGPDP